MKSHHRYHPGASASPGDPHPVTWKLRVSALHIKHTGHSHSRMTRQPYVWPIKKIYVNIYKYRNPADDSVTVGDSESTLTGLNNTNFPLSVLPLTWWICTRYVTIALYTIALYVSSAHCSPGRLLILAYLCSNLALYLMYSYVLVSVICVLMVFPSLTVILVGVLLMVCLLILAAS